VDPYEYLVGKLAQVEVTIEDFESIATETPEDAATTAALYEVQRRLLVALAALEDESAVVAHATEPPSTRSSSALSHAFGHQARNLPQ
jgi:hypothetical protein